MGTPSIARFPHTNNRITTVISTITAILVFLVALGSFALSYNALQDMALKNGITGWLIYVWPLLIDFSLIVFSLAVVTAYLFSESTWKQWSLVGIYTIATIGFNVAHAPNSLQAQIVASIAPVSLFFSFELLMSQLKNSVTRQGITKSLAQLSQEYQEASQNFEQLTQQIKEANDEIDTLTKERDTLKAEIVSQKKSFSGLLSANDTSQNGFKLGDLEALNRANDTRQGQILERREKVLTFLEQGLSQNQIADELKVSLATVKRDVRSLNGKVRVIP